MKTNLKKVSKRLSLVLRHKPEAIGLKLDSGGWADVTELLDCLGSHGLSVSRELLDEVVRMNDKQRFRFSEDRTQICANQGHSLEVDFDLKEEEPPEVLYHGTASRFMESIFKTGLTRQQRHHVHLTEDVVMTMKVGARRGKPVLLEIRAKEMSEAGYQFYKTANNVWLTDSVPVEFLHEASRV